MKIKKGNRFFFYIFLLLTAVSIPTLLSGCSKNNRYAAVAPTKIKVGGIIVSYQKIPEYISTPGHITSPDNTDISAHVVGYVEYENVHIGQSVRKGELLVKLSAPEIQSKYFAAKAAFEDASTTFKRIKTLYLENSVSRQMYDNTLMRYRMAKAGLNEAVTYLNYTKIYSPINGIITSKNISIGNLASPGMPLFTVQSSRNLEFKTLVNVKYYYLLEKIKSVELNFESIGKKVDGDIISVTKSAGPSSQTVIVRIKINGNMENGIIPGMYGISDFKIGSRKAILVPVSSVITRLGIKGVYIAGKNGEAMFQPVKEGSIYKKKYVVILNGLTRGLTVITSNLAQVSDGSYINPVLKTSGI